MTAFASNQPLPSRRAFATGSLAAAALLALAGCTDAEDAGTGSAAASGSSSEAEPLAVAIRNPACIDPYNCQTSADIQVVWQLFDSLTVYDFEAGELKGLAATDWDVSDDACEFTFHLAGGATFHNGEAVNATAFKRAWERIVDQESAVAQFYGASGLGYLLSLVEGYDDLAAGTAKGLSGVTCPDDETLVVALSQPYADFAYVVAHPALGPVPYAASYSAASFSLAPVGNGPYRFADDAVWEDGADIELVRFEDYAGEPPVPDAVRFAVTDDASDAYWRLESGEVDVADVPMGELSSAKKSYGVSQDGRVMEEDAHLLLGSEPGVSYLACNVLRAPLSSADVRRAVSLAIDRDTICKSVYKRSRTAATGIVAPGVHGYRADAWEACTYDVEAAEALLQAEYPVADEDGAREVHLDLVYYEDGGHDELLEFIVDDLSQVGLVADLVPLAWDELVERCLDGEYDLALLSWTPDFTTMDNVLYPLFHSDSIGGWNRSGFADEEVDAALDDARCTVDEQARLELLQAAEDLVAAAVPVVPLLYYGHALAGSEDIASLYCDPLGRIDVATVELV